LASSGATSSFFSAAGTVPRVTLAGVASTAAANSVTTLETLS